jgi:hypothetical protein
MSKTRVTVRLVGPLLSVALLTVATVHPIYGADAWIPSQVFAADAICVNDTSAVALFSEKPGIQIIVGDSVHVLVEAVDTKGSNGNSGCREIGNNFVPVRGPILLEVAEVDEGDEQVIDVPGGDINSLIEGFVENPKKKVPLPPDYWKRLKPMPTTFRIRGKKHPFAIAGFLISLEQLLFLQEGTLERLNAITAKAHPVEQAILNGAKLDPAQIKELSKKAIPLTLHEDRVLSALTRRQQKSWTLRVEALQKSADKARVLRDGLTSSSAPAAVDAAKAATNEVMARAIELATFHGDFGTARQYLAIVTELVAKANDYIVATSSSPSSQSPVPAGHKVLANPPFGGAYDDSWQIGWFAVDKDLGVFGWKYRTWQCKRRALRHERFLRVTGLVNDPAGSETQTIVSQCLVSAAVAAALVSWATDGATFEPAFHAAWIACVGDRAVTVSLEDESHWTEWENCL